MTDVKSNNELFTEEEQALQQAMDFIKSESRIDKFPQAFAELSRNYKKLLRQTKKLVKISDNQQKSLSEKNDQLRLLSQELSKRNTEITESIAYARRIQNAVLPDKAKVDSIFPNYFIMFRPQAIVSGDFYWFNQINNTKIFSVADCTDHGIPGAFMSMLGISFLNEIVTKSEITSVNVILNQLRDHVIKSLHQKGVSGEQKEGMDISMCTIDADTNVCNYAGANNPIYIIRDKQKPPLESENNIQYDPDFNVGKKSKKFLYELRPDKMPIGIHQNLKPFTRKTCKLLKGDLIYLFSDGYADQFGGPRNKKFLYKRFKETLISISEKSMDEQELILNRTIDEWMSFFDPNTSKPNEQIDDMLVFGMRI